MDQQFCNILVSTSLAHVYHVPKTLQAVIDSRRDECTAWWIQRTYICVFELGHKASEATKNLYYSKSEGAVDYTTIMRLFMESRSA